MKWHNCDLACSGVHTMIMWMKLRKVASLRKIVITLVAFTLFGLWYSLMHGEPKLKTFPADFERNLPRQAVEVDPFPGCHKPKRVRQHSTNDQLLNKAGGNSQTRQKILVFTRGTSSHSQLGHDIINLLESVRFKFNVQSGDIRSLPVLIDDNKGRYALIIFEDIFMYLELHKWNRAAIDQYCRDFDVGILYFLRSPKQTGDNIPQLQNVGTFPLKYKTNLKLQDYELNITSPILRIARPGEILNGYIPLPNGWTIFETDHPTYLPVSYAVEATKSNIGNTGQLQSAAKRKSRKSRHKRDVNININSDDMNYDLPYEIRSDRMIAVVQDVGKFDGIQRVIFGSGLVFWLHKVLFLDAISYLSHGKLAMPLERYVQIDIDDVFVGPKNNRMNAQDVLALVKFQDDLQERIPGFKFQLGFSGKFIFHGTETETEGDNLFLKMHDHFSWFPHMWSHMQAHWFNNAAKLCSYMEINAQFAVRHHLNTTSRYAVAPHHAGVFPVHDQFYECWVKVWNITTTSTEEYPHLRPDHKRRGFMYKGVKVLPRQTCGLFTHTMILEKYPGGPQVLHANIYGGALFLSFLYNQFNIFMTHLSNYGNDRLAIYAFDRAINFVQCWTNLKLLFIQPETMAQKYFDLYPEELEPLWLNPCLDKRHLEIWSQEKTCSQLPEFVVVGPQKTGTTALYWFLTMHPDVSSNKPSTTTFEEIQFFNGKNYFKGLDWYMSYFPLPENATILFEKSATYFDQAIVPKRLNSLLPKKPIVVILLDPAMRAYSWYQHMRSHDDNTALQYSFYDVISASRKESPSQVISLQRRCLDPGFYANHLENWLEYLSSKQIIIVDGNMLKDEPAKAMRELQRSLGFKSLVDYSKILKFDNKKGFFCQLLPSGKTKCLGKSKGRQYPEMDEQSREFLDSYYLEANKKLLQTLQSMNKVIPTWLLKQLNS